MNVVNAAKMNMLFDFYGQLLSEKQQDIFKQYYEDDNSLSEISEKMSISRQGIHDALKKSETALEKYESELALIKRHELWNQEKDKLLKQIADLLDNEDTTNKSKAKKLESIYRKLKEMEVYP